MRAEKQTLLCFRDYKKAVVCLCLILIVFNSYTTLSFAEQFSESSGSIAGTVIDAATLQPIAETRVVAYLVPLNTPAGQTLSSSDGSFNLTLEPDNIYIIAAEKPGYSRNQTEPIYLAPNMHRVNITIYLVPQHADENYGTIEGTVFDAASGARVADVMITVLKWPENEPSGETRSAMDGTFSIKVAGNQTYILTAGKEGYEHYQTSMFYLPVNTTWSETIYLEPKTVPPKPTKQWIAGTVRDFDSRSPLDGATVFLGYPGAGTVLKSMVTGTDGKYNFTELEPGPYVVWASRPGYRSSSEIGVQLFAGINITQDIFLTKSELPPTQNGFLVIFVHDAAGGGLEAVRVTVRGEGAEYVRRTASDGKLNLSLPAGVYTVLAEKEGYNRGSNEAIMVSAGNITTVSILLTPVSITGDTGIMIGNIRLRYEVLGVLSALIIVVILSALYLFKLPKPHRKKLVRKAVRIAPRRIAPRAEKKRRVPKPVARTKVIKKPPVPVAVKPSIKPLPKKLPTPVSRPVTKPAISEPAVPEIPKVTMPAPRATLAANRCSKCGKLNDPGDKFCFFCGAKLMES